MGAVLCVAPNPLLDFLAPAHAEPGVVRRIASFAACAGGKALNVARVLARHGHRVIATGFAGGATGAMLRDLVSADGVEPALVGTRARLRVGFQAVDPQGTAAIVEHGFRVEPDERDRLVEVVESLLPQVELVIVGGSVPDPCCTDLPSFLLDSCARAGRVCWLDSYGEPMRRSLASHHPPALVKPNRTELGDDPGWDRAAEVHVTDGPGPVEVRRGSERWTVGPPRVAEVLQTGSGDSYLGALAHARLSGWSFEDQLRYACAAGAANAMRADVAFVGPGEISPLAGRVGVVRR